MKVKKEVASIHVKIAPWIKEEGEKVLFNKGMTMTDFVATKLQEEIEKNAIINNEMEG